ncbi:tumor necrosis factor receptor superfamily member 13C isoform X1 [Grus americana]|uniref:tumor necrosis factor receptor superfamily member 13C isoform X1 n=1 Tax=Grus americana TaxID=9117 RepID=UPI002407D068|nr:tumor necrosis factor receptor superfamily member 13C isoform X1 [Grus americana]
MREHGSHSRSAMSSSGKAAAATSSCLSSQCFDLLTKSCVKCSDLFKDNATLPLLTLPASRPTAESTHVAPTSTLAPTLPSMNLPSTLLIFGVPAVVGLILALAALWGFLACKVGKRRRKRKAADEEAKANMDAASPLHSPGCQDPAALAPAPCPHLNGGLKIMGPPEKAGAKRRPCCRGDADGDIILLSTVYPRHEECNHSFPLPATELGATALVTTKTTQNCPSEERA